MSDSPTPEPPVPSAPASPGSGGADVPPGATPEVAETESGGDSPVATAARSLGLAILAIVVAFGLALLIGIQLAGLICENVDPDSGNLFADIILLIVICLISAILIIVPLYAVLLVTLLLVMSVLGWAAWGRSTFIWTLAAGLALPVVAVVIMAIIGD